VYSDYVSMEVVVLNACYSEPRMKGFLSVTVTIHWIFVFLMTTFNWWRYSLEDWDI